MQFKKFYISLLLLALISCAGSNQYYATPKLIYENSYELRGRIDEKTYIAIVENLKTHPKQHVKYLVNSSGGYVAGILEAMDAIHQHGQVEWEVLPGNICQSACALLAMSSKKINGNLDFHSVYSRYREDKYMMLGNNEEIKNKLMSFGYPENLIFSLFDSINIYKKLEFKNGVLQK